MTMANSIKAQLDEAEFIIRAQMARIAELEAEVQNLKAGLSAHEVLQSIYRTSASESARIRAAQAALGHESAPLKSVEAPLNLVAEEIVEPLADVVAKQRARANRMLAEDPQFRALPKSHQVILLKPNGNADGDD
jgi:hypothetical protein